MFTTTLPQSVGTDRASRFVSPSDGLDPRTDHGLREALLSVEQAGSWETPPGRRLLAEIRRRAVRNAAHVAAATGVTMARGLVDDVLLAAWMVLRRHGDKVLAAARPWAYLMCSAQKQVVDEVRAQQLLTSTASIRGRAREVLPSIVRPVGTTASDMAAAFRHESRGEDVGSTDERKVVPQIGRHDHAPLVTPPTESAEISEPAGREPWFTAFVDLLAYHGADKIVTMAAVDRLADAATYVGWWEWAARRNPVLARLSLSPDQCGALVALVAGSRKHRHNGKHDSLLAVRSATEHGHPVELSAAHRRRLATFIGTGRRHHQPVTIARELATAGV